MWTSAELKQNAKVQMKGRYWTYLGVSLMPQIASYVANIPVTVIYYILFFASLIGTGFMQTGGLPSDTGAFIFDTNNNFNFSIYSDSMLMFFIPNLFLIIGSYLVSIFVVQPVNVGMTRWYIRSRETANLPVSVCFSAFKKGSYLKTVGAMAYYLLFYALWSMLFIIPGIIKAYSYRMIPYIIADNPRFGARKSLKLSCKMTYGHKMEIFILDLSFIGWFLLGFIACCVGVVGVVPYYNATNAELYDTLKKEAVKKGLCTMEELGYVMMVAPTAPDAIQSDS